jgi:hypothetical protein
MKFLITGTDTCGRIVLRRKTLAAALKKAAEVADDGYLDISITAPDGHRYPPQKFDQAQRITDLHNPAERMATGQN